MRISSFVFILVFCFGICIFATAGGEGEASPASSLGTIEYLEGEVFLNDSEAQIGQKVDPGSTIQTGPKSFCEVVFRGKNIFQIQEDSTAVVGISRTQGTIELEKGSLAAVFDRLQRLNSQKGAFLVKTPVAIAGVRGTAFYIMVEDQNNTYICTCNGKTELEDTGRENRIDVTSEHHNAFRFSNSGGTVASSKARLLYHDDAIMNELAEKIRVSIPWGEQNYGY